MPPGMTGLLAGPGGLSLGMNGSISGGIPNGMGGSGMPPGIPMNPYG